MEEGPEQQQEPQPPSPVICPHCRQPLGQVGWMIDANAGLITFYHNEPFCGPR